MTLRSTRQTTSNTVPDVDFSALQSIDCLILAQAVWELGANSWTAVAKLLNKHPLLNRPKSFFTAQTCHAIYDHLMHQAGLEGGIGLDVSHAQPHVLLAQTHYQARVNELHSLILAEEAKYKTIVAEIDAIRAGQWDDKINERLSGRDETKEEPAEESPFEKLPASVPIEDQDAQSAKAQPSPQEAANEPRSPEALAKESSEVIYNQEEDEAVARSLQASSPSDEDAADVEPELKPGSEPVEPLTSQDSQSTEPLAEEKEPVIEVEDDDDMSTEADVTREQDIAERASTESPSVGSADVHDKEQPQVEDPVPGSISEAISTEPQESITHEDADQMEVEEVPKAEDGLPDELPLHTDAIPEAAEPIVEETVVKEEPADPPRRTSRRRQSSVPFTTSTRSTKSQASVEPMPMEVDGTEPVSEAESHPPGTEPEQSNSPIPHDDASALRREGKRKASVLESPAEYLRDRKRPRDESEPLDEEEAGISSTGQPRRRTGRQTEEQIANKRFQNVISLLHSQISQHRNGTIFHNPIKNSEAPDYHEIVKRPMDLKTIKSRIKDGIISNSLEFQRDIYLMFANAMMYNRPGSDIYTMAEDMMSESEENIHSFRQTEGFVRGTHGHRL